MASRVPKHPVSPLIRRIQELMQARGYGTNEKKLARDAGLNETYVRDVIEGRSKNPRPDTLSKLAKPLATSVSYLLGESAQPGTGSTHLAEEPAPFVGATTTIDELDVRASAGPGNLVESDVKIATWQMPREFLRVATQTSPERVKIVTIVGDSMEPALRPNEKVLVDTADTTPTPPGLFIVWDGLGLVAKRIEHLPHSEPPKVLITSDNAKYTSYERALGEAYIQGRILGKWLWT